MCGLAGFARHGASGLDAAAVTRRMLPALARRGPDSEGLHSWPPVGGERGVAEVTLGHRRLAILDLSPAGHQPMVTADGQVGLVFNGCIYNFLELREELEKRGHRFQSQCDTEVLLRGYLEWPMEELLARLRGMFAFAVWDERSRRLVLARDRMGVKPLVYAHRPDGSLGFASTVGALEAAGLVSGEIEPHAVLELLEYGFLTDQHAIYKGLRKLPPASWLEWRAGEIQERSYWRLPDLEADPLRIGFEEAVEETERLLVESVRLRLQADVPIGALLSAGVDSTLVCWAMAKLNANVTAYTVGTPGDSRDESAEAKQTAQKLGIPHVTVDFPVHEDASAIQDLLGAYSEPFATPSALGILHVCQAMKERATVLLTGDGGDDVFLGYPFFEYAWRAEKLARRLPPVAAPVWRHGVRPVLSALSGVAPALRRPRNFLDYSIGGIGAYARLHDGLPLLEEKGVLGPRLAGVKLAQRQIPDSFESARRMLGEAIEHHWWLHFTGEFMTKVDGGTMFWSMEARSPFLDHRMWEFAARLPAEVRFHGGQLKAILREIVRRRLGPEIANRRKQGFTVPVNQWLAERWSGELRQLAEGSLLASQGWVNGPALRAMIEAGITHKSVPGQIWFLLVFEHWLRSRCTRL